MNYCQLSSPGYKEEQLRREEVGLNFFSKMEEFTFVSCTKSSQRNYYRNNKHVAIYDLTRIQFEPQTSVNFDITDSYLRAKQTGFYAFYSEHVEMLISDKWISQKDDRDKNIASMALIKEGEMIKFKVPSINVEGSTLTIFKMK